VSTREVTSISFLLHFPDGLFILILYTNLSIKCELHVFL
jgi:hypothetical protein